jgi:DNA-binding transcriptional LysR family regulator
VLLRDLEFFILVAETRSFRKAAERMDVTQPAVTKAVARLERELGLNLLQRTRTGADLTEAGSAFLGRARQVRLNLEDAIREASDIRSRYQALLRVGVAPSLVDSFFRRGCAVFLRQRPAARFDLTIALSDHLFASLRRGDVDLVLSSLPAPVPSDFEVTGIGESSLAVVANLRHPLLTKRRLRLEQLTGQQWLLPRRGVVARDWLDGLFISRELPLPVTKIEMDSLAGGLLRVAADTELLSIAAGVSAAELRSSQLAVLPLAETQWSRPVGALIRAVGSPPPLVSHFVEVLTGLSKD